MRLDQLYLIVPVGDATGVMYGDWNAEEGGRGLDGRASVTLSELLRKLLNRIFVCVDGNRMMHLCQKNHA